MYELDHMLNGKESRNHLQELAEQAKLEKLAKLAKADKSEHNHQADANRRTIFSAAVLMLTRWG